MILFNLMENLFLYGCSDFYIKKNIMNTNKVNRGSEWRKWDLHVHTPETKLNNQYKSESNVWREFCERIEKSDVDVFGITDYFSLENYTKFINEFFQIYPNSTKVFFPNIEFRIADKNKDGEHIQFHIIFSNQEEIVNKISNFLTRLLLISTDDINLTKKYCCKEDLEEIGYKKAMVRFEETISTIEENFSLHDYIIVGLSSGYGSLRPGKDDTKGGVYAKEIDKKCGVFFGSSKDTDFYLNKIPGRASLKLPPKPVFNGSDSHSFEHIDNKLGKKYEKKDDKGSICDYSEITWVKADPTFEGLKQTIYEPEERVRIQDEKPDFKEDKEIIDKVKFISPNNKFSNEEIYLNPNLNVIIGGKSSGKSILLYSIAKTLLADTKDKLLFKNNGEERYSLKSIDSGFDFEITTKAGISQKISDREDGHNSLIPNIKYIPQNELVKLAEPELNGKGESLNKLVRNLICEDTDSKQKYNDFIKNVKQYDKEREELIDSYFDTLDNIQKLEAELKTKSNKEVLQTNIKTNSEKVEELNKKAGLSDEQIQQYKSIQERHQQNQQRIDLFENEFSQINLFLQELKNELVGLQTKKTTFLQNIKIDKFREYYQTKLSFISDSISQLENLIKEIELKKNNEGESIFVNNNIFNEELNLIISQKNCIENEMKPYQQNEEIQEQIKKLNGSIANDKKLLEDINTLNTSITEKKEFAIKTKDNLFQLYKKSFDEYMNIIELLKDRTVELEKDGLQIRGIAQFNFQKFRENILDFTDGRSASNLNYDILESKKTRISEYEYSHLESEVKNIFEDVLSGKYVVNTRYNQREIMKKILDDYFYDYWEITYKNDKLGEMSTGKASFVILMLIIGLSKSKSPILIDQPEDNLDNRSVSENIISYLRNKKIERQIILVTHNANIVVNADAENVIVANQKGQNDKETSSLYKFDYINGAIENTFAKIETETDLLKSMGIKEHIADIVEGGKEAFKNRERKYGF